MTIALELIARDGVVIAADTEESIAGYMKRSQNKILVGAHQSTVSGITNILKVAASSGAGTSFYLDVINRKVVDAAVSFRKPALGDFEPELQAIIKQFYDDHVIPFSGYPSIERPEIDLIVSIAAPNQYLLWTTQKNVVKRNTKYAAVGAGAFYAETLLARLYRELNLVTACALAVYILMLVKEHVPDCGKETQLVAIDRNSQIKMSYFRDVRDLEDAFKDYGVMESTAFHCVIGGSDESVRKDIGKELPMDRKRIMQLTSQMLKEAR